MATALDPSGAFLQGVNLEDPNPAWNLALTGELLSPDFRAALDPAFASHQLIRDVPLVELTHAGLPVGLPIPRPGWTLFAGTLASQEGHAGDLD